MTANIQEQYFTQDGRPTIKGMALLQALERAGDSNSTSLTALTERVEALEAGTLIAHAEREVLSTYGDTVSVQAKAKSLLKFGRNDNLGTSEEMVWTQGGTETWATTNAIDTFSSSNAGDAQSVYIEGHTVTGTGASSQFTFATQTITADGQNKVTLSTPLARVSRVKNLGTTANAGDWYVYEDGAISGGVPSTAADIHMKVNAGDNQSYKAATTFSNSDYAFLAGWSMSVNKKTAAAVDFTLAIRSPGGLFLPLKRKSLTSSGQSTFKAQFEPYLIVPKNHDLAVFAVGSTTAISVESDVQAFLAAVQ